MINNPQHLGDGCYVHLNECGQIVLTANHHDPAEATDVVYLEPEVVRNLLQYLKHWTSDILDKMANG